MGKIILSLIVWTPLIGVLVPPGVYRVDCTSRRDVVLRDLSGETQCEAQWTGREEKNRWGEGSGANDKCLNSNIARSY